MSGRDTRVVHLYLEVRGALCAEPARDQKPLLLRMICARVQALELHLGAALNVDGVMVVVKERVPSLHMVQHVRRIARAHNKRVGHNEASTSNIVDNCLYYRVYAPFVPLLHGLNAGQAWPGRREIDAQKTLQRMKKGMDADVCTLGRRCGS